jgi:hypothetical protein
MPQNKQKAGYIQDAKPKQCYTEQKGHETMPNTVLSPSVILKTVMQ